MSSKHTVLVRLARVYERFAPLHDRTSNSVSLLQQLKTFTMKNLMQQTEFSNLQHDFYDDLGEAINKYYRRRIDLLLDYELAPRELENEDIDNIRAVYDRWRTKRPF